MMEAETVVFGFQVFLWVFLFFWFFGIGGFLLHIKWYKVKEGWKRTKDIAIQLSLLAPFLIPLAVVALCEIFGG